METTEEKVKKLFEDTQQDFMRFKNLMAVNHKPHPYMIGTRHLVYASDEWSGMLSKEAIEAGEKIGIMCAHKNCRFTMAEHTHDEVLFLQLTRNATNEEAQEFFKEFAPKTEGMFDGICFVDTDEKYRFS